MTKVSIIVPIYNTSKYLRTCIDSLLNQSEKDIEIILINDGSTDNSAEIIKSYKDKRIVYIEKENTGIGSTRNIGISKSKGTYLMFIDSDDYISSNCVERMYNFAVQTNSDIVVSDFYKDYSGRLEVIKIPYFDSSSLKNNPSILNKINLGPCNKIYKKSILKNVMFEEKLKYEDVPFVIKAFKNASKISKLNEPLSYYVIHNNSQTTIRDDKIFDILKIIDIINNELNDKIYHESILNLSTMILTDYTIQQRYVHNRASRNRFINKAFNKLDSIDNNWRKCSYMKSISCIKRFIKSNKVLIKIYCSIYIFIKK